MYTASSRINLNSPFNPKTDHKFHCPLLLENSNNNILTNNSKTTPRKYERATEEMVPEERALIKQPQNNGWWTNGIPPAKQRDSRLTFFAWHNDWDQATLSTSHFFRSSVRGKSYSCCVSFAPHWMKERKKEIETERVNRFRVELKFYSA